MIFNFQKRFYLLLLCIFSFKIGNYYLIKKKVKLLNSIINLKKSIKKLKKEKEKKFSKKQLFKRKNV